jgi:hypothetical protein
MCLLPQSASEPADVEQPPESTDCRAQDPPCGWIHGPLYEGLFLYSLAYTREPDQSGEELRGFTIGAGPYDGEPNEFWGSLAGGLWLSAQHVLSQEIYGAGFELAPQIPIGPVSLGCRYKLGLEYRTSEPDEGFGGMASVGGEFGIWIGRRVQLVVAADREFGFPSGTSNRVQWMIRFGGPEDRWWPRWWPFTAKEKKKVN